MPVGIQGREIIVRKDKYTSEPRLLGVNIGKLPGDAHKEEVYKIMIQHINMVHERTYFPSCSNLSDHVQNLKNFNEVKRKIREAVKNTNFKDKVIIPPKCGFMTKKIVINNQSIESNNLRLLMDDGVYYVLGMGDYLSPDMWTSNFGDKQEYNEYELLNGDLYKDTDKSQVQKSVNTIRDKELHSLRESNNMVGIWDASGILLFMKNKNHIKNLVDASIRGDLACIHIEGKFFCGYGCILLDIEKTYM